MKSKHAENILAYFYDVYILSHEVVRNDSWHFAGQLNVALADECGTQMMKMVMMRIMKTGMRKERRGTRRRWRKGEERDNVTEYRIPDDRISGSARDFFFSLAIALKSEKSAKLLEFYINKRYRRNYFGNNCLRERGGVMQTHPLSQTHTGV